MTLDLPPETLARWLLLQLRGYYREGTQLSNSVATVAAARTASISVLGGITDPLWMTHSLGRLGFETTCAYFAMLNDHVSRDGIAATAAMLRHPPKDTEFDFSAGRDEVTETSPGS